MEEVVEDKEQTSAVVNNGHREVDSEVERKKFEVADADGDGDLDSKEMPSFYHPGVHDTVLDITARATLAKKDLNQDGKLSFKEFWGYAEEHSKELSESVEKVEFSRLDEDGDGFVRLEELKLWESGGFHTKAIMRKLFEVADGDDYAHVTADELVDAREAISKSSMKYHFSEWAAHHEL